MQIISWWAFSNSAVVTLNRVQVWWTWEQPLDSWDWKTLSLRQFYVQRSPTKTTELNNGHFQVRDWTYFKGRRLLRDSLQRHHRGELEMRKMCWHLPTKASTKKLKTKWTGLFTSQKKAKTENPVKRNSRTDLRIAASEKSFLFKLNLEPPNLWEQQHA